MIACPRHRLRRLEDQVREVRRQIEEKKTEFEVERRRAEWRERKWRRSAGSGSQGRTGKGGQME